MRIDPPWNWSSLLIKPCQHVIPMTFFSKNTNLKGNILTPKYGFCKLMRKHAEACTWKIPSTHASTRRSARYSKRLDYEVLRYKDPSGKRPIIFVFKVLITCWAVRESILTTRSNASWILLAESQERFDLCALIVVPSRKRERESVCLNYCLID